MKNIKIKFALALFALFSIQFIHTVAESKKSLHAHAHGIAELTLAIEGKSMEVEFKSPNDNILGFEHSPKTDAEKKSVTQTKQQLEKDFEAISVSTDAQCKIQTKKIEFEFPESKEAHHEESGHDEHEEGSHSEVEMEFEYNCLSLEKIKSVEINVFKRFPTLQKIKVSVVNGDKQFSETLTPKKTTLLLKP